MKRAVIVLVILLVLAAAAFPYVAVDFLRPSVAGALGRALGRRAEIGSVHFTLLAGPGLSMDGVTVYEDPRAGVEPFAYAGTLDARLNLLSLLTGHLEFSSLRFNEASFNLVKPDRAPWNFQMLLDAASSASSSTTPPTIQMRAGRVNLKYGQTKSVFFFDDVDLDVTPSSNGSMDLRFSGVPSRTDRSAQNFGHFFVRGNARPSAAGQQLNFRVELEPSALDAVARLFDRGTLALKGGVSLEAQLSGPPSQLSVKGNAQLTGGARQRVDYTGTLDLLAQQLVLDAAAKTPLALHLEAAELLTSPHWKLAAQATAVPLSGVVDLARQVGAAVPEKLTAAGAIDGVIAYDNRDGFSGNLELADGALAQPGASTLKSPTATVFLKGPSIVVGPVTVTADDPVTASAGNKDTAEILVTYQDAQGTEVKVVTRHMKVADLRVFGMERIPLLEGAGQGTWKGTLLYQEPVSDDGRWSGDFEVTDAPVAFDGLAEPVLVQSAIVSARDGQVSVTRIKAKAGALAITGDYRWESAKPHSFHLQVTGGDLAEWQRLWRPALGREPGLLARTLRMGNKDAPPEWLVKRQAEGTLTLTGLTAGEHKLNLNNARVIWNGTSVKLSTMAGKLDAATVNGELSLDLAARTPAYRFTGRLDDIAYQGGVLGLEGTADASGMDAALLASLRAEGTVHARSVSFPPEVALKKASGMFTLTMVNGAPRWKLTAIEATQGNDVVTGDGASQANGKLTLDLSGGGRTVHLSE